MGVNICRGISEVWHHVWHFHRWPYFLLPFCSCTTRAKMGKPRLWWASRGDATGGEALLSSIVRGFVRHLIRRAIKVLPFFFFHIIIIEMRGDCQKTFLTGRGSRSKIPMHRLIICQVSTLSRQQKWTFRISRIPMQSYILALLRMEIVHVLKPSSKSQPSVISHHGRGSFSPQKLSFLLGNSDPAGSGIGNRDLMWYPLEVWCKESGECDSGFSGENEAGTGPGCWHLSERCKMFINVLI